MLKSLSRLSAILLVLAPLAAVCPGQEQPAAEPPEQAPVTRSPADFTVPELMALADQARQTGRYTDAINLLNAVVQRGHGQTDIDVLRMLGDIAWDMGNAEEARKQWTLVKRVQPSDFGANWGLGRIWLRSGQPRQALGYLETAKNVIPSDKPELEPQVLLGLAQAYAGSSYRRKAIETVQQVLVACKVDHDKIVMVGRWRGGCRRRGGDRDRRGSLFGGHIRHGGSTAQRRRDFRFVR